MLDPSFLDESSDDSLGRVSWEGFGFPGDDPSPDALTLYLSQIGKYQVPTVKEERELLSRACRGDERARHDLVTRNLRLVVMFVTRFMRYRSLFSVSREDLIQAGNIGLMEAIDNFDPESFNVRFSTYAAWHIKNRIRRTIKQEDRIVRLPVHLEDRIQGYHAALSACERELGRHPTVSEVADRLGISSGDARKLEQLSCGALSVDAPTDDSDCDISMIDLFPSEDMSQDERVLWSEAIPALEVALGCLSVDDRMMFFDSVGVFTERKLQSELGAEWGMSARDAGVRVAVIRQKLRVRMKRQKLRAEHFL